MSVSFLVFPAQAGVHFPEARATDQWVSAFAGMVPLPPHWPLNVKRMATSRA